MSLEGGGKRKWEDWFFFFFRNLHLSSWGGAEEGKNLVPFFFSWLWMKRTIMPCKHWLEWTFIKCNASLALQTQVVFVRLCCCWYTPAYHPRAQNCLETAALLRQIERDWKTWFYQAIPYWRVHQTLHTEMVWDASSHRDSHRTWKIDIPSILPVHVVNKMSAQPLTTQHVCSLAGYGHFIQGKKPTIPEINRSSPALQKMRFCSGGKCQLPTLEEQRVDNGWYFFSSV